MTLAPKSFIELYQERLDRISDLATTFERAVREVAPTNQPSIDPYTSFGTLEKTHLKPKYKTDVLESLSKRDPDTYFDQEVQGDYELGHTLNSSNRETVLPYQASEVPKLLAHFFDKGNIVMEQDELNQMLATSSEVTNAIKKEDYPQNINPHYINLSIKNVRELPKKLYEAVAKLCNFMERLIELIQLDTENFEIPTTVELFSIKLVEPETDLKVRGFPGIETVITQDQKDRLNQKIRESITKTTRLFMSNLQKKAQECLASCMNFLKPFIESSEQLKSFVDKKIGKSIKNLNLESRLGLTNSRP